MTVDAVTGALWVVLDGDIRRLTGTTVDILPRPSSLVSPVAVDVSGDGALWIADATTLSRFGHEGPDVTWETDIAAFAADNCTRCHANLGIAHPLDTYDSWVAEVDEIIEEVAAARMPQDDKPLIGGNAELIRRWKDGGLKL